MTEHEVNRIRKRFTMVSTLTLFAVMFLMGGCIYLFSTVTVQNEAYHILTSIAENDGDLVKPEDTDSSSGSTSAASSAEGSTLSGTETSNSSTVNENVEWSLQGIFGIGDIFGETPDYFYTTRYFAVLFDENEQVEQVKTSHITYISEEQAEEYAHIALNKYLHFGSFGRYYYYCGERENGGTIVIYLDRTAQIMLVNRILFAALSILGLGTVLSFFFMRIFSKNIVRSEIENIEKQKQFITNASHELKTPLAVIRANTEMQEMLDGENEWTQSTIRQVDRMSGLIANLVQISRAQEKADGELKVIDIVPAVSETADSFVPVARSEGKNLEKTLPQSLSVKADDSRIRQLVSLLTDNAVKYCDDGGTVTVSLSKSGRYAVLEVSNDYAEGAEVDYTRFFERFYRQDEAHTISSSESSGKSRSGYGIGLSIADSLVQAMKGTIDVSWKDGRITFSCRFRT